MQTTIVTLVRVSRVVPSRGFTTNILAHSIERLSLADLKQEAKRRGLSSSGNKTTLITRIQHVEKDAKGSIATSNDGSSRGLVTAAAPQKTLRRPTLDVKLPDLSIPQDTEGPQIPFLPDFWDSSRVRSPDAIHHRPAADSPMPKVLIVAGTEASSPSHDVSHHSESEEDHHTYETIATNTGNTRFWEDVAEDLGFRRSSSASVSFTKARDGVLSLAQRSTKHHQTEKRPPSSRPLDADEAKGLWIILAILGGSWLAGGLFGPPKGKPTGSIQL